MKQRRFWLLAAVPLVVGGAIAVPRLEARATRADLRASGLRLFGDDASADLYAERLLPIKNDPRLQERLEIAGAGGIAAISYAGLARLSPADLETSLALRARLAESSKSLCAGLWKGGISADELTNGLKRLSPAEKRSWIDLTIRATTEELAAKEPPARIPSADMSKAWAAFFDHVPPAERALLERAATSGPATPPEEACQAFRLLAAQVGTLAPEPRNRIIRSVISPFLVGERK